MGVCAAGHSSSTEDYCDVCGMHMAPPQGSSSGLAEPATSDRQTPESQPCPRCGSPVLGRFCEACGFTADPPPALRWTAVCSASRSHYDRVMADGGPEAGQLMFPTMCPERKFQLVGDQMRIGRRSVSREVLPEIDLTGEPQDPGISRLHAVLLAQADGSWAVIDPGSENGTVVNGTEIVVGSLVPLADGDQICVGAWTSITIVVED